jgi:hypothetical protein
MAGQRQNAAALCGRSASRPSFLPGRLRRSHVSKSALDFANDSAASGPLRTDPQLCQRSSSEAALIAIVLFSAGLADERPGRPRSQR